MKKRLLTLLPILLALAPAAPLYARSGKLWSERGGQNTPLAQVPDFRALAKQTVPAVVSIQVEQARPRGGRDPFFDLFMPGPHRRPDMPGPGARGIGTGFAISSDGLILTNYHVVEEAASIEVTFAQPDGSERKLPAKVLGVAPEYDVALIQTESNARATVCYLGDSDNIEIGDWVMAVGNPFGLSHSVSVGIISAKERRGIAPSGRAGLYDFLQTDASINPGNSGGPLINMNGEVIGINTAINAAGSGIGFAIPINMVKAILPDLKEKGHFQRSWIGIKIQPLTDDLAASYGLKKPSGALVSEVVPGSPAESAGLRDGDVILSFDDKPVRTSSDLPLYASMAGINSRVPLRIWRDKREIKVDVVLQAFPEEAPALAGAPAAAGGKLGMVVSDLNDELRNQFGLSERRGVVIKQVDPDSVAAGAGLRPGDLILALNGKAVHRARDFAAVVKTTKSGGHLRLQVKRPDGKLFLALRIP